MYQDGMINVKVIILQNDGDHYVYKSTDNDHFVVTFHLAIAIYVYLVVKSFLSC